MRVDVDPLRQMDGLKRTLRNKLVRKAVTASLKDVRTVVRKHASLVRRTGALAKSIASRVRTYRSGLNTVGIAGPRSKYTRILGTRSRGEKNGEPINYRPSRIAHLVEKGGRTNRRARPFMTPALQATGQQFVEQVTTTLRMLIAQQLGG